MPERILQALRPVRRRQLGILVSRAAGVGLVAGATITIYLGVMRLIGRPISPMAPLAALVGLPLFSMAVAALAGRSWKGAAAAVDRHYGLKDRTITALAFSEKSETGPLHDLQVADAEAHLARVRAREVVPFRTPRSLAYGLGLVAVALTLLVWPLSPAKTIQAGETDPLPGIVEEAEKLKEEFKKIESLAKAEKSKELEELVKQLNDKVEEMKQPGVDVKEALAKLSEMQSMIVAQQAIYNVGMVDAQLQSLGAAMMTASTTEAAGQALQEGKFDQAAKELEKLEDPPVDKKEAKSLEEKLRQAAQASGEVGMGQMSDAASEMADGVKSGNKAKFQKGGRVVADLAKGQGRRKKIKEILDAELESLSECKGKCNSEIAMRGKKPEKSNSPSENWGLGTSGNVIGDKTNLQSKREIKEITGAQGEGPSEIETTHSPEGRQVAARQYKESYQKYKKMSESVLDNEPIPLGHRQTIRKYFELIRPNNADAAVEREGSKPASQPTTK